MNAKLIISGGSAQFKGGFPVSTKGILNLSLILLLIAAVGLFIMYFYVPVFQTAGYLVSISLGVVVIIFMLILNNKKKIE